MKYFLSITKLNYKTSKSEHWISGLTDDTNICINTANWIREKKGINPLGESGIGDEFLFGIHETELSENRFEWIRGIYSLDNPMAGVMNETGFKDFFNDLRNAENE